MHILTFYSFRGGVDIPCSNNGIKQCLSGATVTPNSIIGDHCIFLKLLDHFSNFGSYDGVGVMNMLIVVIATNSQLSGCW